MPRWHTMQCACSDECILLVPSSFTYWTTWVGRGNWNPAGKDMEMPSMLLMYRIRGTLLRFDPRPYGRKKCQSPKSCTAAIHLVLVLVVFICLVQNNRTKQTQNNRTKQTQNNRNRPKTTEPNRPKTTEPNRPKTTEPNRPKMTETNRPKTTEPNRPQITESNSWT